MDNGRAPAARLAPFFLGLALLLGLPLGSCALVRGPQGARLLAREVATVLIIKNTQGRVLARLDLPEGRFDHVFVHSVHKSPVVERFKVTADPQGAMRLGLYELRYQDAGVGMPTDAEGGFRLEGGVFVLEMDRSFAFLPIKVSVVPGHGVLIDKVFYPFSAWVSPGRDLRLEAARVSRLRFRR